MNYKEFKAVFADALLPIGYSNVKNTFFRRSAEVFAIVNLQKSDWGGDYFINIGIFVDEGQNLLQPPPFQKSHLLQRLEAIVPDSVRRNLVPALDLEVQMSAAERSATISNAITHYAVPFLDTLSNIQGIADYLNPKKRNFAGVKLVLREIVSRRTGQAQE